MEDFNMTCPNCNAQLAENSTFCHHCGSNIAPTPVQQPYAAPYNTMPQGNNNPPPLSVGSYVGMFFLLCIPLVNIILLFVWAFSAGENPNRKNYARAVLILYLISAIISILCILIPLFIGMGITMSETAYAIFR